MRSPLAMAGEICHRPLAAVPVGPEAADDGGVDIGDVDATSGVAASSAGSTVRAGRQSLAARMATRAGRRGRRGTGFTVGGSGLGAGSGGAAIGATITGATVTS